MRPIHTLFRGALLASLLAGLSLAPAGDARAQEMLGVARAGASGELAPLAPGFDRWLQRTLVDAGRSVLPLSETGEMGVAQAADTELPRALAPRLAGGAGRIEVRFSLHDTTPSAVVATSGAEGPLADVARLCAEALAELAPELGIPPDGIAGPALADLAAAGRALALAESGRLHDAWETLSGRSSPLVDGVRGEVLDRARRMGDAPTERAMVIAAAGDPASAWGMVGSKAMLELRKQKPDVALLLAGAEIQLVRENPRQALRFLELAAKHAPGSARVQRSLGKAYRAQGNLAAAKHAYERARDLDPDDSRPVAALAELDADAPGSAGVRLEAAARLTAEYDDQRARRHLAGSDPKSDPRAAKALGDLEARVGHHAQAQQAYARALAVGGESAPVLVGKGRAEAALGNHDAAESSLRRAVTLDPENPKALSALGAVLTDTDRADEGVSLLQKAHQMVPDASDTRLRYAEAMRRSGDPDGAIELLSGVDGDPITMLELARSQQAVGDVAGAEATLRVAARLAPDDTDLDAQRMQMLEAAGDPLDDPLPEIDDATPRGEPEATPEEKRVRRADFDDVAASFANGFSMADRSQVTFLGVREPNDAMSWVRRLTRPREPSRRVVEDALYDALEPHFGRVSRGAGDLGALGGHVDQLYDFADRGSLAAETIASVNNVIGTDGIFVSHLVSHPEDRRDLECRPGTFAVETRLLLGRSPEYVEILASNDCVPRGLPLYTAWNVEAFVLYAVLLVFVIFPVVRGWGSIQVDIQLPEKTKGFFSIHVTKKPDQVKRDVVDKKTGREKIRAKRRIDFLRRFSKHMVGKQTLFKWIPARRAEYTVTVGGPLLDARGEEVVGFFLEEQRALVRRRGMTRLEYDFRPKECAIEVQVTDGGEPAQDVRVAIAGRPDSLRYARDGAAFLYVGAGEYVVMVGSKDTAAEFRVFVERLNAAVPLHVDLAETDVVFRDCPDAVEAYVLGDLEVAANALERAGNPAAGRVRAELYERQGRSADAATALEAAGDLGHAAELRAETEDHAGSAALYEQAGDLARAGAAYRAGGELEKAARCFEEIYDYGNALECWRELGDEERELDLLEKLGEYQDAAQLARERGEVDRAIRNLQQVDQRHPAYRTVCRTIAEIVSERGDHGLAVAKFQEALGNDGLQTASPDVLESYAAILEAAGRRDLALATYEQIQRRDVARTDLNTRIQELREEVANETATATQAMPGAAPTPAAPVTPAVPAESRYELLDEIGRGGMGVVYKARDKRLGRIVALKRLPDNLRDHPTAVELFEREARAAAALNHQNIVTLFDAGEEGGAYFITMELLEGRALNDILARHGRISVRDSARIGIQIAAGMQYAHDRRIVHRDIKTANLFFTNDQVVKIMDFGIAKSLEEVRRSTTVVGGTPYYMAPEQAKGLGVDHRADLYAFGVTLFQLVTGSLPFTEGDVGYLHAHEPPPDPREIQVDVPAEMAELILAMMGKQPDDRPESAAVVAEALHAILASLG